MTWNELRMSQLFSPLVLPLLHITETFSFLYPPPSLSKCFSQDRPDSVPSNLIWTIALLSFHHENNLVSSRCKSIAPPKCTILEPCPFGPVTGFCTFASFVCSQQLQGTPSSITGDRLCPKPSEGSQKKGAMPGGAPCDPDCVCGFLPLKEHPTALFAKQIFFHLPKLRGRQKSGLTQPASQTWKVRSRKMNDSQVMSVELEIKSRCRFYFQKHSLSQLCLLAPCLHRVGRGRTGVVDFKPRVDLFIPRREKAQCFFPLKIGFIKST